MIKKGEWKVADVAKASFDVEGKVIGTVGCGRIGYRVLQRLQPFEPKELLYSDYQPISKELEDAVGVRHVSLEELVAKSDIITINAPLTPETKGLFNKELLAKCKKGVYIVNTARGAIVDTQALVDAVESGHVAGYAGDVWFPQPASRYHPWRIMPRHAMTPHISGTTLDAQARYANGVKDILTRYYAKQPQQPQNIICEGGEIVSRAYSKTGKIETKAHVSKESY
ncbi:formate dehydrogenase (NAD+), partial [Gonapodya sp. JEL0774]